ncbi:hypothetical protein RclHR1_17780006 [Rhizophagus clarus]|uniref:Retrotransposon gag domain-containing protein n=1 Tax=Rhizophagus clarus TaxID=94130 RepID=A0A2Z6QY58_9GLOM|nr:hypothetical protein RclHR1_17780006 [Rhizophagus clarus]
MNPLFSIAGQATQNSGSTSNWMKDLNPQEQSIFELVAKVKEYFDRSAEPRETCLVDFPEFKGGNQDPVEWLEAFKRACDANKVKLLLPDEKHDQTFGIKIREVLPDERHDWTFKIKCCQTKVLPNERHDQTFGIKVREGWGVLPDEKHDWTFGIKCCQTKSMTGLLELSVTRKVILIASYLKGTALTWYNRANIQNWNNPLYQLTSFVHAFTDYFCNPFKLNQWKHQLRNRKQKPGETIEDYIAAIEELWKRVDSQRRRIKLDKIHEFIEGL